MEKVDLIGSIRKELSKSSKTNSRNAGKVPGIFYTKGLDSIPVEVYENSINPLVFTSETHIINLKLDDQTEHECILKDVQFDPVTDKVIHFDLQGIIKGQKLEIEIPILYKGSPIGVKEGGLLQEFLHKLHIRCFPADIPEHFEINVADLKIGHAIHISDLSFDKIEIMHQPETVVVSVVPPKTAKETEAAQPGEEKMEPEVIAKGKEKSEASED
jgi:large subunit ribosomal protein L25